MSYKIIRFFATGEKKIIKTGLTLEQAKEHCNDPTTQKEGVYFDGYSVKYHNNK